MPLYSDHIISNMYYSGSPYTSPYSSPYSSSISPYGSFSASYLNPGGNYSSHSSITGYTRTPLTSRWITSGGRSYSPMLSTISEKGSSSPVRINSPRRTPISSRSYMPSTYTPRPININTADIDVSKDRYQSKLRDLSSHSSSSSSISDERNSSSEQNKKESSPATPDVEKKPNVGIDSSPGRMRSTIKRDRTVVRLHTIKRKDRDSPRKPPEISESQNKRNDLENEKPLEAMKWREKLASDLTYNVKKDKKTLGAKLVEKFKIKDDASEINANKIEKALLDTNIENQNTLNVNSSKFSRRCSMELLAEQASLLDSLIQNENLITVPLDISKIGVDTSQKNENLEFSKKRKLSEKRNELSTTKSDHSLHTRVLNDNDKGLSDAISINKRRSLKKSLSGGSICRLDCISELPKIEMSVKIHKIEENKTKLKPKITSSVEVTDPPSPIKFYVENVTVEEIPKQQKKDIIFSSSIDSEDTHSKITPQHRKSIKSKIRPKPHNSLQSDNTVSAEEDDCDNFWDKIGKRETVYLMQRKDNLTKEKNKRFLYWCPEDEEEITIIDDKILPPLDLIVEHNVENDDKKEEDLDLVVKDIVEKKDEKEEDMSHILTNNQDFHEENENNLHVLQTVPHSVNETKIAVDPQQNIKENNLSTEPFLDVEEDKIYVDSTKTIDKIKEPVSEREPEHLLSENESNNENKSIVSYVESESKNISQNQDGVIIPIEKMFTVQVTPVNDVSKDLIDEKSVEVKENKIKSMKKKTKSKNKINKDSSNTDSTSVKRKTKKILKSIAKNVKENQQSEEKEICEKCKKELDNDKNSDSNKNIDTTNLDRVKDEQNQNTVENKEISQDTCIKPSDEENSGIQIEEPTKSLCSENQKLGVDLTQVSDEIAASTVINDLCSTSGATCFVNNNLKEIKSSTSNEAVHGKGEDKLVNRSSPNVPTNTPVATKKPVKIEKAPIMLIAKPKPLQKKVPQIIHSSSSSESSDDESEDESESSSDSEEFFECETNVDGRTSTGSSDSGFDSSVPTSPAGFFHVKKGGDSPSTSGSAPAQNYTPELLEKELENSMAYDLFRKTGRFTPPARSIPRFRKYTIEDFQFIKVLGKGSFGKVMLAELRETEYYYAVKCLKKDVVLEDDDVECTLIERKVLALGTNHPYLCHLFVTFQTDSHLFFVMEYLNGGDLMFHIQQSGRFPEPRARFYAAEIVSGLKFLHKRGIVYRDLKLDNILLDFDGHVRIADFGMCKLQIYLDKTADTFCGTPDYMAPEIIKGLKYSQTVDWWSFGVLLYEMLVGQSPFSGCDEDELFWSICNEMPSYPRFLSQESHSILTRLLDKDARTRLGGVECMHGDIRDQDFFRPIPWDKLERRELDAPFKPRVRHPLDTQYFDRAFTGERPRLTAIEPQVLRSMDQEAFRGFSYTNPNATDR
ncbi:titin homolog isoform X2 [Aricia agestis]|uniref:titin homolog isoform X2 n=1 Tax=Aricia agestis TaxID=91739 RepID=UPI001C204997|nr:titin homolog isoform X2 [Aricia agestis]